MAPVGFMPVHIKRRRNFFVKDVFTCHLYFFWNSGMYVPEPHLVKINKSEARAHFSYFEIRKYYSMREAGCN